MTKKLFILSVTLFAAIGFARAQDTIMLMKGKRIVVSNSRIEVTSKGDMVVTYQNAKGKTKSKSVDRIFSVSNASGEQVFYTQVDSFADLTVNQMRRFLQGKADFKQEFSFGYFAGGFAAATVGALTVNFKIGGNSASIPIGVLIPSGYLWVLDNKPKAIEHIKDDYPNLPDDEYYMLGVQAAICRKRMYDGALGVLTGGIIWITASCISN